MKGIAAVILLLLQLQPVLGAGTCASLGRASVQRECSMPEHGLKPMSTVGEPSSPAPQSCAFATLCAPAPLAIPEIGSQTAKSAALVSSVAVPLTAAPLDIVTAPPFHPPRA